MNSGGFINGLRKSLKWGFIALVIFFGLLLAINAVDEDPSPELTSLLANQQVKADPDNGYLAMVGINAPLGTDMVGYGTQWVDAYNAATDSAALDKANSRFPRSSYPEFKGNKKLLCNPSRIPCLAQARDRADEWRKLAVDNQEMLARHRRLIGFPHFEESYLPPNMWSNFPTYASGWRKLALSMIALDVVEGRLASALASLESHIAFDRRALLGSRTLIMGMMATSWLRQDYALLAEFAATEPRLLSDQKVRLMTMSKPLETAQIREIGERLLEGEIRFRLRTHSFEQCFSQDAENKTRWFEMLARPFYKETAIQNRIAREFTSRAILFRSFEPENTEKWLARFRQIEQSEADADDAAYSWRDLYNPLGNLMWVRLWKFEPYIQRLSDLMEVSRLARLQAEVVVNSKASADMPG